MPNDGCGAAGRERASMFAECMSIFTSIHGRVIIISNMFNMTTTSSVSLGMVHLRFTMQLSPRAFAVLEREISSRNDSWIEPHDDSLTSPRGMD